MLEQVFEALREPVVVFDLDGRPVLVNRAAYELAGLPPSDLDPQGYLDLLGRLKCRTLEGTPLTAADLPSRRVLAGAPAATGSFRLTREDGTEVTVEVTATPVLRDGRTAGVVAVLRDVTDAERTQATLHHLIRTLRAHGRTDRAALRASNEAAFLQEVCDILVEDCGYRMLWVGLAEHDDAKSVRPVAHAGFADGYIDLLGLTWADTERGRGPTGSAIRTGQVCMCRDVHTDPSFAPWRAEAQKRGFASSIALPLEVEGCIIGALTIYFAAPGAADDDELVLLRELARDFADGIRVLRLRATEKAARETLARQAEQLARSDRVKDEFLGTLSHELRTPLSTILVWANLLARGGLDEKGRRRAAEAILRNAEVQRELVNDVLDVSRIISGTLRLEIREVMLGDVLNAAVEVVRPAADAKGLALEVETESDLIVSGDPGRLQQVFWNILSNAVKFTPEGGRVRVALDRREGHIRLRVSDSGVGVRAEYLPHIFERFSQQDPSTSRRHGGLGLGLAIVRHLVELHGGTVAAESPGEGLGATFTVVLPSRAVRVSRGPAGRHVFAGEVDPEPELRGTTLRGLRILAVDDDEDARELLQVVLAQYGARVSVVASSEEALRQLRAATFDLMLTDISMPVTDGYALIAAVRALPGAVGRLPAIALTAYGRVQDRQRALAAGFQEHLSKPVSPEELAVALARFTARAGG